MGFNHSITLPGVSSTIVEKRVVEIVDGDETKYVNLGRNDTLIDFTANNSNISYSYVEYDSNDNPVVAATEDIRVEKTPDGTWIAPEAPPRSREAEQAIESAEAFMRGETGQLQPGFSTKDEINDQLRKTLPSLDPFWPRWIVEAKPDPPVLVEGDVVVSPVSDL